MTDHGWCGAYRCFAASPFSMSTYDRLVKYSRARPEVRLLAFQQLCSIPNVLRSVHQRGGVFYGMCWLCYEAFHVHCRNKGAAVPMAAGWKLRGSHCGTHAT